MKPVEVFEGEVVEITDFGVFVNLGGIDGLEFVRLTGRDVVRHRIVADIVDAYERDAVSAAGAIEPGSARS